MNRLPLLLALICLSTTGLVPAAEPVTFMHLDGQVAIRVAGRPFAVFHYRDEKILRPYLAEVRTPDGAQVTRNLPPAAGVDRTDHATMHPGIWLAFGDLGGADFWRNKGRVELVGQGPLSQSLGKIGRLEFASRYVDGETTICREACRITIVPDENTTTVLWDSTFTGEREFAFGDQEEMGLGVRVATPLEVANGGTITNAEGLKNERHLWGKTSAWCDYSGQLQGQAAGVLLVPDPANFRACWFHARDYGFFAANPFGRRAFTKGEASRVVVAPGQSFRLRFAIVVHGGPVDLPSLASQALARLKDTP